MKNHNCIICRKPLNDGIIINGRGICKSCEERLLKISMGSDFYNYYFKCIKRELAVPILKGEDNNCQSYRL